MSEQTRVPAITNDEGQWLSRERVAKKGKWVWRYIWVFYVDADCFWDELYGDHEENHGNVAQAHGGTVVHFVPESEVKVLNRALENQAREQAALATVRPKRDILNSHVEAVVEAWKAQARKEGDE